MAPRVSRRGDGVPLGDGCHKEEPARSLLTGRMRAGIEYPRDAERFARLSRGQSRRGFRARRSICDALVTSPAPPHGPLYVVQYTMYRAIPMDGGPGDRGTVL
jgi:hypothetical protein